jgi:orotate phosphoribosyltransferase
VQAYQKQFIEFCIQNEVIRFGEFTLKSGRMSPYFFNAGLFNSGQMIAQLGKFYAATVNNAGIRFDILFGPAYKGIPLVVTTAIALAEEYNIDKPFCFNRKVAKDHGDIGGLVGAPLQGQVLMIEDVITAGTTTEETVAILQKNNAKLSGICISLNRQEKGYGDLSAIQEIEQKYNIPVISIITLENLITHIKDSPTLTAHLDKIRAYQEQYGIK